jgi:hypothetical protein
MIEERRKQVASLLAKSKTQTEIAQLLGYDQSTISDDVKALKMMSQKFLFDLAKSDLAHYYKTCIDGIEEAKKEAWKIHERYTNSDFSDHHRLGLAALKVVMQAEIAKFELFKEGPNMLAINTMSERLNQIEHDFQENNRCIQP